MNYSNCSIVDNCWNFAILPTIHVPLPFLYIYQFFNWMILHLNPSHLSEDPMQVVQEIEEEEDVVEVVEEEEVPVVVEEEVHPEGVDQEEEVVGVAVVAHQEEVLHQEEEV